MELSAETKLTDLLHFLPEKARLRATISVVKALGDFVDATHLSSADRQAATEDFIRAGHSAVTDELKQLLASGECTPKEVRRLHHEFTTQLVILIGTQYGQLDPYSDAFKHFSRRVRQRMDESREETEFRGELVDGLLRDLIVNFSDLLTPELKHEIYVHRALWSMRHSKAGEDVSQQVRGQEFPNRAQWLEKRLLERGLTGSRLHLDYGGPDRKTIEKILRGEPVRNDTLEALARSLSAPPFETVDVHDIPQD